MTPEEIARGASLRRNSSPEKVSPAFHENLGIRRLAKVGRSAAATAFNAGLGLAGQETMLLFAAVGHGSLKHQFNAIEQTGFCRRASSKMHFNPSLCSN